MNRFILPLILGPLSALAEEPVPSPTELEIPPKAILSTRIRYEGKRRIIFEKLDPAIMAKIERQHQPSPPPPSPLPEPIEIEDPTAKKPVEQLILGASVHLPDPTHPDKAVTELTLWSTGTHVPTAILWVNANFLWLTGAPHEIETGTARHSLMLIASQGSGEIPADLPFPADGTPTLVIAEGDPTEAQLAPIDELLRLYQREKPASA